MKKPKHYVMRVVGSFTDGEEVEMFTPRTFAWGDKAEAFVHELYAAIEMNGKVLRYEKVKVHVTFEPKP